MPDLPVMLKLTGRHCLIVGGGAVAARRAAAMLEAGARVTVLAPTIDDHIDATRIDLIRRAYEPGLIARDFPDARVVVIATDDPDINDQVQRDAAAIGALVNRAENPQAGDFTVPAHAHHGPLTLAVHTDGISAAAAAAIRRELSDHVDPDWPVLLEAAREYRPRIQQHWRDAAQRRRRLQQLTDADAMRLLKSAGLPALHERFRQLVEDAKA